MTTAYSYIRFSTPAQAKGDSLRRQLAAATEYAEKHGLDLDLSYRDLGLSAYKAEHRAKGALGAFLAKAEQGEIASGSYLLVENIDRLSREAVMDALDLFRRITRAGITVVTLADGRAYSEASINENWTELIITLGTMARGHEESKIKALRIRAAKESSREKARTEGRTITRNMPPWIESRDGKRVVIEERAEIVRQIFALADQGMGRTKIARWLHTHKIAPWGKGKRASDGWHESFISRLLANRAVIGEHQPCRCEGGKRLPDGAAIVGYFPAIVDTALFARVNGAAKVRKELMGGRRAPTLANLVSGLVKCDDCGGPMRYRSKRREGHVRVIRGRHYTLPADAYFVCSNAERHGGCSNRATIAYHGFERALLDSCLHLAMDDQAFANSGEVARLNSTIAERERDLELARDNAKAYWTKWAANQSEALESLANAADADAVSLKANLEALNRQRDQARGRADQAEHLRRVSEIRDNLRHKDMTVRIPLRQKVMESLRTTISMIVCDADRRATVIMAGGLTNFLIERGKVVDTAHLLGMADNVRILRTLTDDGEPMATKAVADVKRRAKG